MLSSRWMRMQKTRRNANRAENGGSQGRPILTGQPNILTTCHLGIYGEPWHSTFPVQKTDNETHLPVSKRLDKSKVSVMIRSKAQMSLHCPRSSDRWTKERERGLWYDRGGATEE